MRFLERINHIMMIGAALALIIIICATLLDIVFDIATQRPINGVYDVVEACLAFVIFLALPSIFQREENIRIDLIDYFLPPPLLKALILFTRLVTLGFVVLTFISMLNPFLDAWNFGDTKYETGIPIWVIWIPILMGAAGATLSVLATIFRPSANSVIFKE
ncbi:MULTISPECIES: TRAP transporter small permease [Alphaproteobacteria]|uniref:TRAP transporter small permease protein n=2 Tax=Alphaproteobacteria TaxID=28211 RepID=A0A512HNN6_9HYPH|nr:MULTISPECIES: TRAP transporter small permease subunit [Alphaproteobacteria]GEO87061.1 hypothetical protein RNA01_39930 [Ciceribacter naphthalenivorans]GLR23153.1 hypothetical protein GCM10007920_29410 [Ciceribacter naphthalenivorans]GLT06009.1 hypothetical protein GCM10007926_29410 [Sphingomonas psychrolutea]